MTFCSKMIFLKRMMSIKVNTKLVDSLKEMPLASKLGDINELLTESPELNNYTPELFQKAYDFLHQEGFKPHVFAYMITQNPKLLTTPHEKLFLALSNWRALQFGERDTLTLLERFPELFHLQHSKELTRKIETIKEFVGSGSKTYKVLLNSPAILNQSLSVVNEKIDYLKNVMYIDAVEVYKSDVFASDIIAIKTRHIFLERLGIYIRKKKKEEGEISKNPRLCHIYDTSDKRFATKICHVTLPEFETFQELYKRELDDEVGEASSDEEDYQAGDETRVNLQYEKV